VDHVDGTAKNTFVSNGYGVRVCFMFVLWWKNACALRDKHGED
jgi:hypothetical protein